MLKSLVIGGLTAATLTAPVAVSPADAATCGTLPRVVQGDPLVRAGQAGYAYLYHDTHGWHLRVTHPGSAKAVVSGSISASSGISRLHTFRLESGDTVRITNGTTLSFRMTNVGHLDGVDFSAECSRTMRVNVRVNGAQATPAQVWLGAHRVHPRAVPFTVTRS